MTPHQTIDDQVRDQAVLYALGGMTAGEMVEFERHLQDCRVCRDEAEVQRVIAARLAFLAPEVEPPADQRERLLERIRREAPPPRQSQPTAQPWKQWDAMAAAPFTFVAADTAFEPTSIAGIEARQLFVDRAQDRVTMLVRMAPGTAYPRHVHGGIEECFVISGDLRVGDLVMHAGDYQRADAGSRHVEQSTEAGCVLFLVSSLQDELLD